ncbi:WD40 repeat domain-containing protein [Actinoplanes sp. NPDC048988]|uniref:WD40 repeat domain-containing protein n=1 Tax=Actinoplanes sp. NPDC048988 TaxID=3363901 RepID=UPI00371D1285
MLRAALTSVLVAATTLVAAGASSGPAAASPGGSLRITGVSDVLVDPARQQVLISDAKSGTIVVTDYRAATKAVRSGLAGIGDLVLSPDGKTVYAAVADAHSIVAFDAATMTETGRHFINVAAFPRTLAVAGGTLFVGYDFGTANSRGALGALDLPGGTFRRNFFTADGSPHEAPRLLTAAGAPGRLVATDVSSDATTQGNTWVYDVADGVPAEIASTTAAPGPVADVELSRDGSQILGVGGPCSTFVAPASDPARRVSMHGGYCGATALGVHPDGGRAAISYDDNRVILFAAGLDEMHGSFDLYEDKADRLVWQPGGSRLFAVTHDWYGSYELHVFFEPVTTAISLKATPAAAKRDTPVEISGRLNASGPIGEAVAGLDVTRTDAESPSGRSLPQVVTDSNLYFSFSDYPPVGGTVTYKVTYRGSGVAAGSSAQVSITVARSTPALQVLAPSSAAYGSTVTVTALLDQNLRNRTVAIWADPAGAEPPRLLRNAKVDAYGVLTTPVKLTRTTALIAKYAGDAWYTPVSSPARLVYTRVAVSLTNSRQYKTAKLGSLPTAYYRKTVHPLFSTTMTPYPGRKERLQFEVLRNGKWAAWRNVDVKLSAAGKAAYTLTGAHTTGVRYRVRAAYLRGTSGDTVNATTYGAYRYFTFTK